MEDDAIFVLEILHRRWQSFYTWKAQFYADMWAGRNQGAPHPREDWSEPEGLWDGEGGEDEGLWDGGSFTVKEYGENSDSPRTFNLGLEKFEVDLSLLPLPQYTTCASTSGSHRVDDDPDILHFIPFSDDGAFDHEGHSKKFRFFAWQDLEDPDGKQILSKKKKREKRPESVILLWFSGGSVYPSHPGSSKALRDDARGHTKNRGYALALHGRSRLGQVQGHETV